VPLDPRTPVIAGVGQVTNRADPVDPSTWVEPLTLMVDAIERAGCGATGQPGVRSSLLDRVDEMFAVPSFVWQPGDPARAVADALGISVGVTRIGFAGGTIPQTALFDAATRIAAGRLDVAVIVGAEAIKTRDIARKRGERVAWTEPAGYADAPQADYAVPDALTDHERAVGLIVPAHAYALFEHARRRIRGLTRSEHLEELGALAALMSRVASANDGAWLREPVDAKTVTTPAPDNRMISAPYTKLLTSNVVVDMGAALIVTSLEAARVAGVPDDDLVFPLAGAAAREQWLISRRLELSVSLAMRECVRRLFDGRSSSVDQVSFLDLYSCFPIAVELASDALGIDPLTDERAPSVTGGMTFFGGPGNNYVTHSIATMAETLRRAPGEVGLVTGLGWYASTHSWGTYSTTPPRDGFRYDSVQADVDAAPLRDADDDYSGPAIVESYTVVHDREGRPSRAITSLRTPADARRLVAVEEPEAAAQVLDADPLGATVHVRGTTLTLP
jgi:acetyl-CoA C-acetyltransferase